MVEEAWEKSEGSAWVDVAIYAHHLVKDSSNACFHTSMIGRALYVWTASGRAYNHEKEIDIAGYPSPRTQIGQVSSGFCCAEYSDMANGHHAHAIGGALNLSEKHLHYPLSDFDHALSFVAGKTCVHVQASENNRPPAV
jgi:hypothetical protein